jgi:nucleoside-diphosphate-sugar epimerase
MSSTHDDGKSSAGQKLRVVVTGGAGRIGRLVVKLFTEAGHEVTSVDRKPDPESPVKFVECDLRRREAVQPILENADAVVHLGEMPTHTNNQWKDEVFAHNTAVGSCILQTAADLKLKRVIYTSTCQVYGLWGMDYGHAVPRELPMDETHPLYPRNVYALSKACNEQFAKLMAEHHGLSVAAFRMPWVPVEEPDDKWIKWFESQSDRPGRHEGMGTYIHGKDVARVYLAAVEQPRPGFDVYHITAPEVWTYLPLREWLEKHHPDFPKLPSDWPLRKTPLSLEKARQHFGWEPKWNFLEIYRAKTGKKLPGD